MLNFFFVLLARVVPPTGQDIAVFWVAFPLSFLVAYVGSTALFVAVEKPFSLRPSAAGRDFFGLPRQA
jgi:hypothetical protein